MMIGRNERLSVFHAGTHWLTENELAVPCLIANTTPMTPRPTSTITLSAALRLGMSLLHSSGRIPTITIAHTMAMTMTASQKGGTSTLNATSMAPMNRTKTDGAHRATLTQYIQLVTVPQPGPKASLTQT